MRAEPEAEAMELRWIHAHVWLDLEEWDGVMTIPASISTIDFKYSTAPRARDFRVNAETFNDMIFRPIS